MNTAVIFLGSNIAARANIEQAKKLLGGMYKILAQSRFIYTPAFDGDPQPDFLNGAILLETVLEFDNFKKELKKIETQLGRERSTPKFAPRTMDIDIIVWNNKIIHQDFYERDFLRELVSKVFPNSAPN